jgi:hypothetical protein
MQPKAFALIVLLFTSLPAPELFAQSATQSNEPSSIAVQASSVVSSTGSSQENNPSTSTPKEDFGTLSVRGMRFALQPVITTERDEQKNYTRELVRLQWRGGDSIELFVFTPHGVAKAPAILYLYSYPSDVDRFYDQGWATRATADGFAAVGFVSALTGQRYRMRPMKEWFVSELRESIGSSVHDVQLILDYLASRGDIDMNRIGMFGQGSGGAIAVLAAHADTRIKAIDLLDPWGDWPEWLNLSPLVPEEERNAYLQPDFLKGVSGLDPVDYLADLKDRKLRLQQILNDPVNPREAADRMAKAAPATSKVARFDDSTAHYTAVHRQGVSGWLKDQLYPPVQAGFQVQSATSSAEAKKSSAAPR